MSRTVGTSNATPYAAAPAVGPAGDTYFNTTSKQLFISDGTAWLAVGISPQGFVRAYSGADQDAMYPSGGTPQSVGQIQVDRLLFSRGPAWTAYGSGLQYWVCPTAGVWRVTGFVAAGSAGFSANQTHGIWKDGVMMVREVSMASTPYANHNFSIEMEIPVGGRIALVAYNGQTGATTNGPRIRTVATGNNLDPVSPILSAWRLGD